MINSNKKVVILDRYQRYANKELYDKMLSYSNSIIFIVDAKEYIENVGMPYEGCLVEYEEERIYVS